MLRLVSSAGRLGRRAARFSSSSARHAEITLTVDGKDVSVPQGTVPCPLTQPDSHLFNTGSALIQACEAAGAAIPRCAF